MSVTFDPEIIGMGRILLNKILELYLSSYQKYEQNPSIHSLENMSS